MGHQGFLGLTAALEQEQRMQKILRKIYYSLYRGVCFIVSLKRNKKLQQNVSLKIYSIKLFIEITFRTLNLCSTRLIYKLRSLRTGNKATQHTERHLNMRQWRKLGSFCGAGGEQGSGDYAAAQGEDNN